MRVKPYENEPIANPRYVILDESGFVVAFAFDQRLAGEMAAATGLACEKIVGGGRHETLLAAAKPIVDTLSRMECGETRGAGGTYSATNPPVLRDVSIPVKLLAALRDAMEAR